VSVKGRVDGGTEEIKPESLTVPLQPSDRDRVLSINLECQFVALAEARYQPPPLVKKRRIKRSCSEWEVLVLILSMEASNDEGESLDRLGIVWIVAASRQ
jgi:hypothetical protein